MKIGLFAINMGVLAARDGLAEVARHADGCGLESLWTGEHVVLPDPQAPPSPLPPETEILDPAVALAYIAGVTENIRLGTGIIILPQRNPVVLAKELASVDVVSNGRFMFGVGIGYLAPEFEAIGVPFNQKGPRTEAFIGAMRALWEQDDPSFDSEFVAFSGIQQRPRPVQRPVPIVMGGHSVPAFSRSVRLAHGWYGFALDLEATKGCLEGLGAAAREHGRPSDLGTLEITVTPPPGVIPDAAMVEAYREAGVDRLAVMPIAGSIDDYRRVIDSIAAL